MIRELDPLERNQIDPVFKAQGQVDPALVRGVFRSHVQAQGRKIAVDKGGIVAFVPGQLILTIPVVGNGCE